MSRELRVVLDDLAFPEGPRWHEGRLWFSDMHAQRVVATTPHGEAEVIMTVPANPSGLGWRPDGALLVVSMVDRTVIQRTPDGASTVVADLSDLAPFHLNDMVVDATGRAYVGNFGFDLHGGAEARATVLIAVDPDGSARVVADELLFPNGSVITPDGATLVVAESGARRLTAFSINADGSLDDRREFATLPAPALPDGICLDHEGAIWAASPSTNEVLRLREGGEVVERISTGDRGAYACMLGGADGTTLFICTAATSDPAEASRAHSGRIEAVEVDVAHAGRP